MYVHKVLVQTKLCPFSNLTPSVIKVPSAQAVVKQISALACVNVFIYVSAICGLAVPCVVKV